MNIVYQRKINRKTKTKDGHMSTFTVPFESPDKVLLATSCTKVMTSYPGAAIFTGIIKIVTMSIKINQ